MSKLFCNYYCINFYYILVINQSIHQMRFPNVRFAVKTTSVTPSSITGRYQCNTQADRDVGYREWFKTVPAIYHDKKVNIKNTSIILLLNLLNKHFIVILYCIKN